MAAASESNQAPRSVFWEKARGVLAGTCSGLMKLAVGQPFDTIKVRSVRRGRGQSSTNTLQRFGVPPLVVAFWALRARVCRTPSSASA
jgi:hypothetical protein